jgi:PIN domain nuclease of toxin-antitoxin system
VRCLLDSHAVLWATLDDERLPDSVRDLIADRTNHIAISVASTWELTMKALIGRLRLPEPPETYFEGLVRDFGYELLPIHQRHVAALPELPAIHADPFDRMLVAQALVEDIDLVTGDSYLGRYPIRTIW